MQAIFMGYKHHWIAIEVTAAVEVRNLHNYLVHPPSDGDVSQEKVNAANAACQESMNTKSGEDREAA